MLWGSKNDLDPLIADKKEDGATLKHRHNKSRKGKKPTKQSETSEVWRVFGINIHPDDLVDVPAHSADILHPAVSAALQKRLGEATTIQHADIVRRSLDARKKKAPKYVYTIDVTIRKSVKLRHQPGRIERLVASPTEQQPANVVSPTLKTVVIVGAGPAGLFCALRLAESRNIRPIVLERGQPVERRGRDIGGLMHRKILNAESNFAFGEGGAGTWSDGKLTTRIGRNAENVRYVLETFVRYGAPKRILVDGAPHLGTDALVRLLRNLREDLKRMGGDIRFGCKVADLIIEDQRAVGVVYEKTDSNGETSSERIFCDSVVFATGHSARDTYEKLHYSGVKLEAKGFAVGFRVEHPQRLITQMQYGTEWGKSVVTGKKLTDEANREHFDALVQSNGNMAQDVHLGKLPVPSYRLATNQAFDGKRNRGVYSFCMCPGGQIVPASTNPSEVCVNGMSFSKRDSQFANSALVVTIDPDDEILDKYKEQNGVLAGLAFQRAMEQRAAAMGGGNLTVPVQRLTDFLNEIPSTSCPASSYRLSVKPSACHEIYPEAVNAALRDALLNHFGKQMPGFVCDEGLLHGVETRTSSPLRICREKDTLQAVGIDSFFPVGEGAGFAGGIVSAAVDGLTVSRAVLYHLGVGKALDINTGDSVNAFY